MAAPGSCGPGSASNPRKFSEKIALQRQRQAEDTAAFEEVMMDIGSTRVQVQKLRMNHMRGPYYGGSLPNVNQIGSGMADFQGSPHSPLDPARNTRHHGLVERVHRDPRRMMSPLRRHMRQIDSSPYGGSYLSPHQDHGVRRNLPWGSYPSDAGQMFRLPTALNRTNSDSALHTSLMNPSSQEPYHVPSQVVHPGSRRNVFPFPVPAIEENLQSGSKHLLKPCDTKKLSAATARPKSCEVPGINVYPSMDQTGTMPPVPSVLNTGGSLPDLTNLRSPLPAPLDPENSAYKSLSGGNSTGNLANTMTHLDISRVSLLPAFDMSGFSSLSRPSLQSSLSNPNLQTSLSSTSLQSSFSNPSLQSSLSSQSLPSSLSNQSLSPSASNHSLQSTYSTPSSPSSSCSFPPMAPTTMSTSPRRRVPLSPLTLPMGGESRRPHQKQFSPTMSPTLSSITQGVPLDTSKFTGDQRLPMYHFNPPNLLQQPQQLTQQAMHQSQHASQQPMHHSQHASQQAMHQTQHLVQQVAHQAQHPAQHSAHQSEHPSQAMHQPQNMTQMMHMHQPPQAPQQTIPSYQQPDQQTVMQPSHMSQLGRHATQVQTKQMEQQPLHAEQQMTHKSPPPSRQGMHQAQHPSQQGVHQAQHPNQQGVHQAQHPSQQGVHQAQHPSQQGVHQGQHPSQQGVHQAQHPSQQGVHHGQHPSQQGVHQGQHPSQQGVHQGQHPSQQGVHQGQHPSQQGVHQGQHPSQQGVHQGQHPSQQGVHQAQHPSQQGVHQGQHPSQQGVHQAQHPSQQGVHQAQHPSQQGVHQAQHPSQQGVHQAQHPSQQGVHQAQHASRETVNQQHQHLSPPCQSQQHLQQSHEEHPPPYQDTPSPSMAHYFSLCQQNSGGQPYQHLLGDYNLDTFEQCNMEEGSNGRPSPSSVSFLEDYHHLLSGDLSENNIYNSQPVSKQNLNNGSRLDPIPNIILTAVDSPPGFSKEITSALSCIPGFEVDQSLGLDDDLNIEPLGLDGLNMLTDPYALLTDPLVEDSFRSDRLQ